MTMQAWIRAGWLRNQDTQPDDVRHLWSVMSEDLQLAARGDPEPAACFEHAYNAALKCCLILLYAEGYRLGRVDDVHHVIIRSLPLILGAEREVTADFLDACRARRDRLSVAGIGQADAAALLEVATGLSRDVRAWLATKHPEWTFVLNEETTDSH